MADEPHKCHRPKCERVVPEHLFACKQDWYALPKNIREDIWAAYVPGQEITKTPSMDYLNAAVAAIRWWERGEIDLIEHYPTRVFTK